MSKEVEHTVDEFVDIVFALEDEDYDELIAEPRRCVKAVDTRYEALSTAARNSLGTDVLAREMEFGKPFLRRLFTGYKHTKR